jgi:hypothetical protein
MAYDGSEYAGGFKVEDLTEPIAVRLVQSNGKILKRIPYNKRTEAVYVAALKSAPYLIREIDPKCITSAMWRVASSADRSLAKFVPNAMRTCDDYLELWKTGQTTFDILIGYTPAADLPRIYHAIIENNPKLLKFVPEKYRTREMCNLCIVAKCKDSIPLIPPSLMDQAIYDKLVSEDLIELEHILDRFVSEYIAYRFLRRDVKYIHLVPERFRTQENVYLCAYLWKYTIESIPAQFRDALTCKLCFNNVKKLDNIPVSFWTEDMLIAELLATDRWNNCLVNNARNLSDVPVHLPNTKLFDGQSTA